MQRYIGKITDENIGYCYFHHKQNLHCVKQQLYILMLATMLLAWHVVGKKLSHFVNAPVILFILFSSFNIHYEQNCDISNILKYFSRGTVFLISVSVEWSVHSAHIL